MTDMLPTELQPIASFVKGLSRDQVRTVRDQIAAEVHSIESRFPERTPMDDPGRFQLERDRVTCARRRREVDYLDHLIGALL
jgi:hypothetical protein